MRHRCHGPVQEPHAIRLHRVQVHDRRAAVLGPAPGGAREQLDVAREQAQPRLAPRARSRRQAQAQVRVQCRGPVLEAVEEVEAVAADPADAAVGDAVGGGVALRAGEGRRVDLDADDEVPVAGARERDGVAAGAGEEVDDDARGRGAAGATEALAVELGGDGAGEEGEGVLAAGGPRGGRGGLRSEEGGGDRWIGEATYSAMGSAVTPNQASSVM